MAAAVGLALFTSSCSFIVDTNANQCTTDAQCSMFPGRSCQKNVCVARTGECKVNADCEKMKGDSFICRKDTLSCVDLKSEDCQTLYGDYKNDNAFIIGSILPTSGDDASSGEPDQNAIKLAIDEIKNATNGLPPVPGGNGDRRPMVLVGCDDHDSDAAAVAAAKHLSEEVGVPAIVGGAFSGGSLNIATTVTIKSKALLFSPSATAETLTGLDPLVWRTAPGDILQAEALALYLPTLEANIKKTLGGVFSLKLAILNKGDSYGSDLAKRLAGILKLNGKPVSDPSNSGNYRRLDYGAGDEAALTPKVTELLDFKPHIVVILGTQEGIDFGFKQLEEKWMFAEYRPHYVFSDGGQIQPLWDYVGMNADLRQRVTGTAPGADASDPLFQNFFMQFAPKFGPDGASVFGAAGSYDIAYMLAYGAVGIGAKPLTGENFAVQMTRMSDGPEVDSSMDIKGGFDLAAAGPINFNGASGPLQFDPMTGTAPSDIQIWCLPAGGSGGTAPATNSGKYYDVSNPETLAGEFISCK